MADLLRLVKASDEPEGSLEQIVRWQVERALMAVRLMVGSVGAVLVALLAALLRDDATVSGWLMVGAVSSMALGLAYAWGRYEDARELERELVVALDALRLLSPCGRSYDSWPMTAIDIVVAVTAAGTAVVGIPGIASRFERRRRISRLRTDRGKTRSRSAPPDEESLRPAVLRLVESVGPLPLDDYRATPAAEDLVFTLLDRIDGALIPDPGPATAAAPEPAFVRRATALLDAGDAAGAVTWVRLGIELSVAELATGSASSGVPVQAALRRLALVNVVDRELRGIARHSDQPGRPSVPRRRGGGRGCAGGTGSRAARARETTCPVLAWSSTAAGRRPFARRRGVSDRAARGP